MCKYSANKREIWGLLHKIVSFETYLPVGTNFGGWYICIIIFCYTKLYLSPEPYLPVGTFRNELFYATGPCTANERARAGIVSSPLSLSVSVAILNARSRGIGHLATKWRQTERFDDDEEEEEGTRFSPHLSRALQASLLSWHRLHSHKSLKAMKRRGERGEQVLQNGRTDRSRSEGGKDKSVFCNSSRAPPPSRSYRSLPSLPSTLCLSDRPRPTGRGRTKTTTTY